MSGDLFKIQFIRSKTSSLFIPEKWARKLQDLKKLEDNSTIKIVYDHNKTAYFGWQQSNNFQNDSVGVNATVATNLGLKEGDHISLVVCNSPAHLKRVEMSPLSTDDLEMIELSSGLLQSTLLNQVRIVWKGQLLTAWISNSLPIILQVGNMEPDVSVGRLEQLTEVVIGDPINNTAQALLNADEVSTNVIDGVVASGKSLANSVVRAVQGKIKEDSDISATNGVVTEEGQYIFRVHPLNSNMLEYGPLDALIPHPSFHKLFHFPYGDRKSVLCKVSKLGGRKDKYNQSESIENQTSSTKRRGKSSMHIQVFGVDVNLTAQKSYYDTDRRCIYVSNNLRIILNLEIGSRVVLSDFDTRSPPIRLDRVDLYPYYGLRCLDLGRNLKQYIDQTPHAFLLSTNMLITIPTERGFVDAEVRLLPTTLTHTLLQPEYCLNEKNIHVLFEKRKVNEYGLPSAPQCVPRQFTDQLHLSHLQGIIHEGVTSLKLSLGLIDVSKSHRLPSNVLLLGKSGCGKTSTAKALCSLLQEPPHFIHTAMIRCRPLKGKTIESLCKNIQNTIDDCVYHQPSVLILDDLESIAGVPNDQDQSSQASAYFNRVARMLLHTIKCLQVSHSVSIIATAPSLSSVSPSLIPPRGIHLFNTQLELPELSRIDRQGILEKLLNQKLVNKEIRELKCLMSVEECGVKTEGYCCQDLSDLVDKATLSACMREALSSKKPIMESCDILQALSDSTPMLLRGVSLHKDSAFGWDDIGGLMDVKAELKEVFEWPVKFPELFQNSPLRQQSGLLLYGAPGTGKTMLAAAVARECGLNFISVKGPELLSKYIGASEEAVRNVFFKAQSAKPCVLFFDEFDSLAPRRGHDNTGVTDRVVNQLLTQLDGVESLVGVWVLAATSRPDLLDPALLRPGRLDRSVLCPLPDKENRLAILKALSRKMNLEPNVDLTEIAAKSEGFTGADLQAILYSAQLNAVQEERSCMNVSDESHHNREQILFKVGQSHIDLAAKNTRPSLTIQERSKYFNIYRKFGADREKTAQNLLETPQRATLA